MLPILQLGPLALQVPGLLLILSLWIGLIFSEKYADKKGLSSQHIYNMVLVSLIYGIIGARLAYFAYYPDAFEGNLFSLLSLNPALLDPMAGAGAVFIAGWIYLQKKKLPVWNYLDALTPLFATVSLGIAAAHLASGDAFGAPTDLPWGIKLWGDVRHPTQIYELLGAALILALVIFKLPTLQGYPAGFSFFTFIALSALARLFIETFRGDSIVISYGLRQAQVFAWMVLAFAVAMLGRLIRSEDEAA